MEETNINQEGINVKIYETFAHKKNNDQEYAM